MRRRNITNSDKSAKHKSVKKSHKVKHPHGHKGDGGGNISHGPSRAVSTSPAPSEIPIDSEVQWDTYMFFTIPCYHGTVVREEAEEALKNNGDFFLRREEKNGKFEYILSAKHDDAFHHLILNRSPQGCFIKKERMFSRPEDCINFYANSGFPIDGTTVILRTPVDQPSYYLNSENIEIKRKIGEGAYGEVSEAVMRRHDGSFVKVAVKNLKGFSTKADRDEFMKEFRFMNQFEHQNIVRIYGVTANSTPMMMVLEMCYGGSLNSYLRKNPLPYKHLIKYCTDAARGMCYLSSRDVIHRDIAARNCLLGGKDDVKISDFGLSVISKEPVKAGKAQKIAIRWCAPETLETGYFQMKTDVWSYGILMWEIFNHCQSDPFPGKTNAEAKELIKSGDKPLELPKDVPSNVEKCYSYCLFKEASYRPNFVEILKFLSPREIPPIPEEVRKSIAAKALAKNDSKKLSISKKESRR
uniref:Tyrosine-protein kinase n=1 Tax=Parastrongyloides trichosuri TaxID=131310 RepID=A0A0N4ZF24_PARTI